MGSAYPLAHIYQECGGSEAWFYSVVQKTGMSRASRLLCWRTESRRQVYSPIYAPGSYSSVFRHSEDPLDRMSGVRKKGWPMRNQLTDTQMDLKNMLYKQIHYTNSLSFMFMLQSDLKAQPLPSHRITSHCRVILAMLDGEEPTHALDPHGSLARSYSCIDWHSVPFVRT